MHYCDVIMGTMAFQITSLMVVYSIVCSGADQRKHQSSTSQAFVLGIHWWPVNCPHKWPVTWKMFPFNDVIMGYFAGSSPHIRVTPPYIDDNTTWVLNYQEIFMLKSMLVTILKPGFWLADSYAASQSEAMFKNSHQLTWILKWIFRS